MSSGRESFQVCVQGILRLFDLSIHLESALYPGQHCGGSGASGTLGVSQEYLGSLDGMGHQYTYGQFSIRNRPIGMFFGRRKETQEPKGNPEI